jgi:putative hydrolase of the HAD superfamily
MPHLASKSYYTKNRIARRNSEHTRGSDLTSTKAVIFDFIGTLTDVKGYNLGDSKVKLCKAITEVGFNVSAECFLNAYSLAHEKYRVVRYQELVEVTNAVWIAEALNSLGFKTSSEDARIKTAVNAFFEDYLASLELRPCAKNMLRKVSEDYKLGLISNFTYYPVIYAGLRKLGINRFFNAILVSQEVGWRKPHREIFQTALRRLNVSAEETVYVGDSPLEDIKGAKTTGMKTIFVPSQFYSLGNLLDSQQKPDMTAADICELAEKLPQFLKQMA